MRPKPFVVASILSLAVALAPAVAHGQRVIARDCWDRGAWRDGRYCDSAYGREVARVAREAAARAREQSREIANRAREEARRYANGSRMDSRAWDRSFERDRIRGRELSTRIRESINSRLRRIPYYREW